eukprot:1772279-Pyramimonas_sp.AAC.1
MAPGAWRSDAPLHERGLKVLGAPFGSDEFVRTYGVTVAAKREQLLKYLPKLPSLHAAWLLLYFCAVPRLNHVLRTLPPERVQPLAEEHDAAILA